MKIWHLIILFIIVAIIGIVVDLAILKSDLPDIWKWILLR